MKTTRKDRIYQAANLGKAYPKGTTLKEMFTAANQHGITAMELAAYHGHYPRGTTAAKMANAKSPDGWNALYHAAAQHQLPRNTTIQILFKTHNAGESTLDTFLAIINKRTKTALNKVLAKSTAHSENELRILVEKISPHCPTEAALWAARELKKLRQKTA